MKAFFAAAIVAIMPVVSFGVSFATDSTYYVNDGVLVAYNGSEGELAIPEYLGIIEIGYGVFMGDDRIITVIIPDGVKAIGDYAFTGCQNLAQITLPSDLTEIGSYAFSGCYSLQPNLRLPGTLTAIGDYAFLNCYNLETIYVPFLKKQVVS